MVNNSYSYLIPKLKQVEQSGILVDRYEPAFPREICGHDRIIPNCYLLLTHQGSTRVLYDMQETTLTPNMVVLVMHGHLIRFIDRTDDYVFSRLVITPEIFDEMLSLTFSHDVNKYHSHPEYILTDEQVQKLMKVLDLLAVIAQHDEKELPHRRQLLLAQLIIGYEFLNYYRNEQLPGNHRTEVLNRFCDLVVAHYHESREVKFYADMLHLTPKHLSKTVKEATGGMSPSQWIEQYVITRAKLLLETHRNCSLKEISHMLGFGEPTSFYRYFKHATGFTAKHYREG